MRRALRLVACISVRRPAVVAVRHSFVLTVTTKVCRVVGMTDTATLATVNIFGVKVGDIFHTSWGYDQTNCDYFEVVRVTRCGAELRPVRSTVTESVRGGEYHMPARGEFRDWSVLFGAGRGDRKLCKVKSGYRGSPMVVLCRDHAADLWDGRPKFDSGAWGR